MCGKFCNLNLHVTCRQDAAIIDGKKIAEEIQNELKVHVDNYINAGKKRPKLVAILVGDNSSSLAYVSRKMKAAKSIGNVILVSDNLQISIIGVAHKLISMICFLFIIIIR